MKRTISLLLCILMICTAACSAALADGAAAGSKRETVYVLCDADGNVEKTLVSCHLRNGGGAQELADVSDLEEIEVVKGDATFSQSEDGSLLWQANGEDVYYQGTSASEPPVGLTVRYELDGTAITAAQAQGATGRLTIRFDYENRMRETREINGVQREMVTPFLALTALVLDNGRARNIEATHARLIDDGTHTIVLGAALPGLQESLDISGEDLEIPEYVEISADVEDFEVPMTLTLAGNEALNAVDVSGFDRVDELKASFGELTGAMAQLIDGSGQLYDGLATLAEKSAALADGVAQLAGGATALSDGLTTLCDGNGTLNDAASQIFEGLLSAAGGQLAAAGLTLPELTAENYSAVLGSLLDGSYVESAVRAQVESAVRAREGDVRAAVTEAVRQNVEAQVREAVEAQVRTQVLAAMNLAPEDDRAEAQTGMIPSEQQEQVEAAVEAQMDGEAAQAIVAAQLDAQMGSPEVAETIDEQTQAQMQALIEQNLTSDEAAAQREAALEQLGASAETIQGLLAQLESVEQFRAGLQAYTQGVASAQSGAEELDAGARLLLGGAEAAGEETSGGAEGSEGIAALPEGVDQLREGALALRDGISKMNDEGIQKLADAVNGELTGLVESARALLDASQAYDSFSGATGEMESTVRFLYRTDTVD